MYEFYGYQGIELRVEDVGGKVSALVKDAKALVDGKPRDVAGHFVSEGLNPDKYRKAIAQGDGTYRLYHDNRSDYVTLIPGESGEVFKDRRLLNRITLD